MSLLHLIKWHHLPRPLSQTPGSHSPQIFISHNQREGRDCSIFKICLELFHFTPFPVQLSPRLLQQPLVSFYFLCPFSREHQGNRHRASTNYTVKSALNPSMSFPFTSHSLQNQHDLTIMDRRLAPSSCELF